MGFLVGFFISVNVTFLPMHTLRLDGMPRRYITYAGFMSNYNRFCSFRALSSIIFLFIGLAALNPSMSAHFAFTMLALNTDPSFMFGFHFFFFFFFFFFFLRALQKRGWHPC